MKVVLDLIDKEIKRKKEWIEACRHSRLAYAISEYEKEIEHLQKCKEVIYENIIRKSQKRDCKRHDFSFQNVVTL